MKCPHCNADTRVIRTTGDLRRRECFNLHRFTTVEAVVQEKPKPEPKRKATA